MRRAAYFSDEQEAAMARLGVKVPDVIRAGLTALEGAPPLQSLDEELRASVQKTMALLDAAARGKVAVVPPAGGPRKTGSG